MFEIVSALGRQNKQTKTPALQQDSHKVLPKGLIKYRKTVEETTSYTEL